MQFVAARDRTVVSEAVRALFPSAPTGAGWTWSALERWLWILLIQRCEATALTELQDVLALVDANADADVQCLRQVLPGVWQPSRLQQRLWASLLHRYGGAVRVRGALHRTFGAVLTTGMTACAPPPDASGAKPAWVRRPQPVRAGARGVRAQRRGHCRRARCRGRRDDARVCCRSCAAGTTCRVRARLGLG